MKINYICISDLHLGAEHSLLTNLDKTGEVNPSGPSKPLVAFTEALNALLENLPVDENTRLVLLGDVLDMGFSDTTDVIKTFKVFAETFLSASSLKKISKNILFLPGNHDHQLWQSVKNNHLVRQIEDGSGDELMQVTSLLSPDYLESYLLRDIIRNVDGLEDVSVQVAYPNLAEVVADQGVVFHHGHYTESLYLIMSKVRKILEDELNITTNINHIEQDNGYWINFLWSSLGSAGFGTQTLNMYETILDAGATHEFILKAAKKLKNYLVNNFGLSDASLASINKNLTLEMGTRALLDVSIGKLSSSERYSFLDVLSPEGVETLSWYLAGPVAAQFKSEHTRIPDTVSFVYGHTHKPYQDRLPIAGYKEPVNIYNTGGWAIDKPVVTSLQGAAVVFVDDSCNVASLRLFNCSPDSEVSKARAAGVDGVADAGKPLLAALEGALIDSDQNWVNFQNVIDEGVSLRVKNALRRYFNPVSTQGAQQLRAGL